MTQIKRMSIAEYNLRMKAYRLQSLDEECRIAKQAWMNREIKATKKKGKSKYESYYKTFDSFFNFEERENAILGKKRKTYDFKERFKEAVRKHGQCKLAGRDNGEG